MPQVAIPYLSSVAQYGFLGVPVFFTISGFVIAYSAEGRTPLGFAIARFSRIYPTFVFCMTLTFVTILVFGGTTFNVSFTQWAANLFVAAPALGEPYVGTSYWSLVIEIVFYAWVALLLALGLFPRRVDVIILVWLGITFANELTIDAPVFEKRFMADDSGFFAVGLLIYQYFRGRRDLKLYGILALSVGTSVFQAIHKLERLGVHAGATYDARVVAAVCLLSIARHHLAAVSAAHAAGLYDPHRCRPDPPRRTMDRGDHRRSRRVVLGYLAFCGTPGAPLGEGSALRGCSEDRMAVSSDRGGGR